MDKITLECFACSRKETREVEQVDKAFVCLRQHCQICDNCRGHMTQTMMTGFLRNLANHRSPKHCAGAVCISNITKKEIDREKQPQQQQPQKDVRAQTRYNMEQCRNALQIMAGSLKMMETWLDQLESDMK